MKEDKEKAMETSWIFQVTRNCRPPPVCLFLIAALWKQKEHGPLAPSSGRSLATLISHPRRCLCRNCMCSSIGCTLQPLPEALTCPDPPSQTYQRLNSTVAMQTKRDWYINVRTFVHCWSSVNDFSALRGSTSYLQFPIHDACRHEKSQDRMQPRLNKL